MYVFFSFYSLPLLSIPLLASTTLSSSTFYVSFALQLSFNGTGAPKRVCTNTTNELNSFKKFSLPFSGFRGSSNGKSLHITVSNELVCFVFNLCSLTFAYEVFFHFLSRLFLSHWTTNSLNTLLFHSMLNKMRIKVFNCENMLEFCRIKTE